MTLARTIVLAATALAAVVAPRASRAQDAAPQPQQPAAPPAAAPPDDEVVGRVREASLRIATDPATESGSAGTATLVGGDGLVVTAAHAVGDVGIGCPVWVTDGRGQRHESILLEVDAAADTALLRARTLAGRIGLRVAAASPREGLRVFTPTRGRTALATGAVRAVVPNEVRLELDPTSPDATGGPVVDDSGHVVGLLQRPAGGASRAFITPVITLRRMLAAVRRDAPVAQCAPAFGGALPWALHLGVDVTTVFSGDVTRPIYIARATGMYFQRWYVRFAAGYASTAAIHASVSGGPVLFRTRNDGVVAVGGRVDAEFGPVTGGLTDRREFYGLEVQATGYITDAVGLAVNLSGGADRRFGSVPGAGTFGGVVALGVGFVWRTQRF